MGMESKGERSCLFFREQSFQGSRNLGGNEVRIKPQQFRASISYATGICQAIIIRVLPFFLALSAICPDKLCWAPEK